MVPEIVSSNASSDSIGLSISFCFKLNLCQSSLKCSLCQWKHKMYGPHQRAKKVVSDSPGLEDFAIGLVTSVFNLPDGQAIFS